MVLGTFMIENEIKQGWILISISIIILGSWALTGIISLIQLIIRWLKSNWEEAKRRAEKEIK